MVAKETNHHCFLKIPYEVKYLPINTTNSLRVVARVPTGVENDDSVGAYEVDTERPGASRHQEQVYVRVGVELVN